MVVTRGVHHIRQRHRGAQRARAFAIFGSLNLKPDRRRPGRWRQFLARRLTHLGGQTRLRGGAGVPQSIVPPSSCVTEADDDSQIAERHRDAGENFRPASCYSSALDRGRRAETGGRWRTRHAPRNEGHGVR